MAIKSAPYYWVVCDVCGVSAQEGSEYSAWGDKGGAEEMVLDSDWHVEGGNHLCEDCTPMDRDEED